MNEPSISRAPSGESGGGEPHSDDMSKAERMVLRARVLEALVSAGLEADRCLFSGYTRGESAEKTGDEHITEDGRPIYFFGSANSLGAGDIESDDEEQNELYFGDPIHFAGHGGIVGVYDRDALLHMGELIEQDDNGFNSMIAVDAEDLARAKQLDVHIE